MLKVIVNRPQVLALAFSGHLSRDDVSRCFDLLERAPGTDAKQHLYLEITGLSGIDSEILMQDLARGLRLLGRLEDFGRVAVVSDQAWVRFLSRAESALLPGIGYRVYTREQHEQALAWVEGREPLPYGHAVRIIDTDRREIIGIEIDGRLAAEEIGEVSRALNRRREEYPIKALLLRIKALDGFDPGLMLDAQYLQMKLGFLRELDRYALVGGPDWLRGWVDWIRPLMRLEIRSFETEDEAAAWAWLGAAPVPTASLAA